MLLPAPQTAPVLPVAMAHASRTCEPSRRFLIAGPLMTDLRIPSIDADRPRLFIHAGMHKTGTTYVQSLCNKNRVRLREGGVLYPPDALRPQPAHHGLPAALRSGCADDDPALRWLRDLDAAREPILLSSETFCSLDAAALRRVRDALPNHTVVPILFFREWTAGLLSRWQQRLKMHRVETFSSFLEKAMTSPSEVHFVDYRIVLDKFSAAFGRQNVVAASFDNALADGIDIVDVIFQIMGVSLRKSDLAVDDATSNSSLSTEDTALLHLVRKALVSAPNDKISLNIVRYRKEALLTQIPELRSLKEDRALVQTGNVLPIFEEFNRSIFDAYGDRFVNAADNGIFAKIGAKPIYTIDVDAWLERHETVMPRLKQLTTELAAAKIRLPPDIKAAQAAARAAATLPHPPHPTIAGRIASWMKR